MLMKKMLRDMRIHKIQFISIFIMSFLALFIYSGLGSETKGYQKELDNYYAKTHFADAWLYGTNFTEEDKAAVQELDEVDLVQTRLSMECSSSLEKNPSIKLYIQDENKVNQLHITSGSDFDSKDSDGIWIDYEFAKARDLHTGDSFELTYMGMSLTKTIRGIVMSPEYVYKQSAQMFPDHWMNGFAYIATGAIPEQLQSIRNEMILTLSEDNTLSSAELETKLEELLKADEATHSGGLSIFLARENHVSHTVFMNEVNERKAMTAAFPIVFLAIALLTILTTMTRLVQNQRTQIGVLKALGFKKHKIMRHYIAYGFGLTFMGGLLGSIAGPIVLPAMFYGPMQMAYTLPVWKSAFTFSTLVVLIISVLAASLITFLTCHNILKDMPAQTLRPKAPSVTNATRLEQTKFWRRRSFSTQWNVRDVLRSKSRSIMAIVGVAGCMGLLITGFGCLDAFNSMINIKFDDISLYKNKYVLEESITDKEIDEIVEAVSGEKVMNATIEIRSIKEKEAMELAVNDHVTLNQYLGDGFKPITLPEKGMAVSKKIAEQLDIELGDKIQWHIYGENEWKEASITAIYRDPAEQGAAMNREEFESYGCTFRATSILSDLDKVSDLPQVKTIENIEDSKSSILSMLESMYFLIGVLCVSAALLAIVVLYNLGVLSFAEKERELATLKVLGFKSNAIRKLLVLQNIWLTIIGLVPGYYFGIIVLKVIMSSMGTEFDLPLKVMPLSILICASFTMFLSIIVNYLFSGKVKKLDMVSSLKGVE